MTLLKNFVDSVLAFFSPYHNNPTVSPFTNGNDLHIDMRAWTLKKGSLYKKGPAMN